MSNHYLTDSEWLELIKRAFKLVEKEQHFKNPPACTHNSNRYILIKCEERKENDGSCSRYHIFTSF